MSKSSASSNRLTRACSSRIFFRACGFSQPTFYKWCSRFGGIEPSDAAKLRELEAENNKLKKLLAEAHLDIHALKSVFSVKR
jgi:putative transposase